MAERLTYAELFAMSKDEIIEFGLDKWTLRIKKAVQAEFSDPAERDKKIHAAYQKKHYIAKKQKGEEAENATKLNIPEIQYKPEWLAGLTEIQQDVLKLYFKNKENGVIAETLKEKHAGITYQMVQGILDSSPVSTVILKVRQSSVNANWWISISEGCKRGDINSLRLAASIPGVVSAPEGNVICPHHGPVCPEDVTNDPFTMDSLRKLGDWLADSTTEPLVLTKEQNHELV